MLHPEALEEALTWSNDWLDGSADDETILGGPGNDRLEGRPGGDNLIGGGGNDTIRIRRGDVPDGDFEYVESTQSVTDRSQIVLVGWRTSELPAGTVPGILQGDTMLTHRRAIRTVPARFLSSLGRGSVGYG